MQNPLFRAAEAATGPLVGLNHPCALTMYRSPPPANISLEEFELFAIDRLQLLRALEGAQLRNKSEAEMKKSYLEAQKKFIPLSSNSAARLGTDVDEERRKDYISHFILRLAYCKSEDLRNWLVRMETLLFRLRWENLPREERQMFLENSGFDFTPIPNGEKERLAELLISSTPTLDPGNGGQFNSEAFFKVPFESVPDLVGHREVYLADGWAYVPQSSLLSIVLAQFKSHVISALEATAKSLPRIDDDDRLKPLLNNMSKQYLGKEYGAKDGSESSIGNVSAADIDQLSNNFPPCMRHLHTMLRRDQHLKHQGRMQFGLFLKGVGLSLEEALVFWRKSFSRVSDDQFQKNYAYNIRHNYGQEGKRANYTPYSCMKIITSNAPSTGDHHGCPFKHFGKENLQNMLYKHGLNDNGVRDVMELAKNGHYQVACTKYFEITKGKFNPHAVVEDGRITEGSHNVIDTISHPNQFFELSVGQKQ